MPSSEVRFEIGHVLFIEIAGYTHSRWLGFFPQADHTANKQLKKH